MSVSDQVVFKGGKTYVAFVFCSPNIGLMETGASISMADMMKALSGWACGCAFQMFFGGGSIRKHLKIYLDPAIIACLRKRVSGLISIRHIMHVLTENKYTRKL